MNNYFEIDKLTVAEEALKLRSALIAAKADVKGYGEEQVVDWFIKEIDPILDLCVEKNIDEPFDLIGYMTSKTGRIFGDQLSRPELKLSEFYYALVRLLRGGMTFEESEKSKYFKEHLMPKKFKVEVKK